MNSTMTLAFRLLPHREVGLKMRRRRLGFWAAEAADVYRAGYQGRGSYAGHREIGVGTV